MFKQLLKCSLELGSGELFDTCIPVDGATLWPVYLLS